MPETTLATANIKIRHDKRHNMTTFLDAIGEAAGKGADLLVLPEVGLQGYADFAFGIWKQSSRRAQALLFS